MTKPQNSIEFTLREATDADIPQLSIHHRKMCEEVWEKKGRKIESSISSEIEQVYSQKLRKELADGVCKCWVIEHASQIVASGAVTIFDLVPTPNNLSSKLAFVHSMYTEEAFRGKNFAGRILEAVLNYCRANGIKRGMLNASEAGRPVYERLGFVLSPDTMRIVIE